MKKIVCPNCNSSEIININDKFVCARCGLIIEEDTISLELEKRFFDPQKRRLFKRSTSEFDYSLLEFKQSILRVKEATDSYVLKRSHLETARERLIWISNNYLQEYCEILHIPNSIKNEAIKIISRFLGKKFIPQKDIPAFVTAVLFIVLRNTSYSKPLNRILKLLGIRKKVFSKYYRLVKEKLKIIVPPPSPEKYIITFGNELKLSRSCINLALKLLSRLKFSGRLLNRDSAGLAAAILYYATQVTGEKRSQRQIAQIAAVTETTIKNRYKEIISLINE